MKAFRTILFAADFSENSREAFSVACSLARADETRLHVLAVVDLNWVAEDPVFFGQSGVQFYKQASDEHRLKMAIEKLRDEYVPDEPIDVEFHAREGEIAHEILAFSRAIGADLIVTGTHGRTGMNWLISGSVATAVLRKAHCPVLALRSSVQMRRDDGVRVILHPTDFSQNSRAALDVARSLARITVCAWSSFMSLRPRSSPMEAWPRRSIHRPSAPSWKTFAPASMARISSIRSKPA